ncbi:transposase [Roseateles aquatilis]|uniref:Transposase n=1 Tax=Roseateles aquatilis TaxID=431061 RepID=A0A246ITL1_9BURK|nr:transposase [Roseateles aquatilis]OWQ83561.1 transposase [Roseateles aquatilis]
MARLPRLALAGHLHHLIHRGHNLQPIAVDDEDRKALLAALQECAATHKVAIHAYALLPNHLHLLATPAADNGLSRMMQALGRRYVGAFNQRHGRVGTLWEGRFRAAPLEADPYLLLVMRSIELNPQRAGLVAEPGDYAWSSAAHHLGRRRDPLISDPPGFWALGNTPFERELAWRRWLEEGEPEAERLKLIDSALKGWPLGSARFLHTLAELSDRPLTPRPRGRPRSKPASI